MMKSIRINEPNVVHETVDGEVVIVDLDSGLYFSTDGVGAAIWTLIVQGRTPADIAAWASDTYGPHVLTEVEEFVTSLRDKSLIVDCENSFEAIETDVIAPGVYTVPELLVYSDMEELLLLDPVHDVSEDGWPNAAG